jgi:hypothetical protein
MSSHLTGQAKILPPRSTAPKPKPAPPPPTAQRRGSTHPLPLAHPSVDPFSHISIVHSFVGKINADCLGRRFLICLRDHLPFVGIERGCDVIAQYARSSLLRKAKYNAGIPVSATDVVLRLRLIVMRGYRRLRGRRKLKALMIEYANRRRSEIFNFVQQWTRCEHETQRKVHVSFLEYSATHVSIERKRLVAASYRMRCIHDWVKAMRDVTRQQRQQCDIFYLWTAQQNRAVSSGAYYAIRTLALETLRFRRVATSTPGKVRILYFQPTMAFGRRTTLRDVALEEARLRFHVTPATTNAAVRIPKSAAPSTSVGSFRSADDTDRGLLRRLVIQRTQKASLVDPDLLVSSAYLNTRIVTVPPPSSRSAATSATDEDLGENDAWSAEHHPLFRVAPTTLPMLLRQEQQQHEQRQNDDDDERQQLAVSMAITDARRRSVAEVSHEASPVPVDPPSHVALNNSNAPPPAPTAAVATPLVAIPKTVISMVGDQWIMNPFFSGRIQHVVATNNTRRQIRSHPATQARSTLDPNGEDSGSKHSSPRGEFTAAKTFMLPTVTPRNDNDDQSAMKTAHRQHAGDAESRKDWKDMVRRYEHKWAAIQQGQDSVRSNVGLQTFAAPTTSHVSCDSGGAPSRSLPPSVPKPLRSSRRPEIPPHKPTPRHTGPLRLAHVPLNEAATLITATSVAWSRRAQRPSTSHSRYYGGNPQQHRPYPEMDRLGLFRIPSTGDDSQDNAPQCAAGGSGGH